MPKIYNAPAGFEMNPIGTADALTALRRWKGTHAPRLEALQGLKDHYQAEAALGKEARTSLASEREANAILTAEIEARNAALMNCARQAEALKRACGPDPESGQAVRNAKYQAISTTAHIALGTVRGPAAPPVRNIADYEPDDEDWLENETACGRCSGAGTDPMSDHLLPCPNCQGEQRP